jgi:hypothetical protein
MSVQRIFEKVAALKAQEEEGKGETKREGRQQTSGWVEVETFVDKPSGVGVVITGRDSGPQRYSIQLVGIESNRVNKFISLPNRRTTRPMKEVAYLLIEKAEAFIEEKLAEAKKRRTKDGGYKDGKDRRKKDGKKREDKKRGPTGLSALAREDAQKGGKSSEFVGKTAKKKNKGKK